MATAGATKHPHFIVFAGPNGSGKSTFKDLQTDFDLNDIEYVNPDALTKERLGLSPEEPFPSLTQEYFAASKAAQQDAERIRKSAIEDRRSICFETVMSHESKVDEIELAKESGFNVVLFFLGLDDPRLNVTRVRERVRDGGHPVDERKIILRYFRTMRLLERAVRGSDVALIYDTSSPDAPFDALARIHDGKSVEVSTTASRPYWSCRYLLQSFGLWAPKPRELQLKTLVEGYLETGEAPKPGARRQACLEVAAEVGRSFRMAHALGLNPEDAIELSDHVENMTAHRI